MKSDNISTAIGNIALAATFIVLTASLGYKYIGLPPVIIVGGSGLIGLFAWSATYLKRPTSPEIILPCFLLTVAALEVHMMEEYLTGFAPAMSRVFNITWTERGFLIVFAFVGPALYALTAIGLFYRVRFAGFLAWFIFIGPGVAEFTHFIFPLLRPAINPETPQRVSHLFPNGVYISQMPNYYVHTAGTYYFAGMYTAILPMIPGIYAIYRLLKEDRQRKALLAREDRGSSASIGGSPYLPGLKFNVDDKHGKSEGKVSRFGETSVRPMSSPEISRPNPRRNSHGTKN